MTREEEQNIISRILAGNQDEFELLVKGNEKRIYNLALRMTGSAEDAFDLSQEAFLKAYYQLESFGGESSFSTWLYRIASNVCIDFLRKEKKRKRGSVISLDGEGEERELQLPDTRYAPETELQKKELREAINRGLLELPADYRQALIMREISGLSYNEISEILEAPSGTVKSRISRGRKMMAVYLTSAGNFFDKKPSDKMKGE